jgi:hypothetical protein
MAKKKIKVADIERLVNRFQEGRISVNTFAQKMRENGQNPEFWLRPENQNCVGKPGNDSRNGFKFNCYTTKRGLFFQNVIKKAILKAIDFAHSSFQKNYDKDIFVYDDERLQKLNAFGEYIISSYFSDSSAKGYKDVFMRKILDIVLGLAKEDVYYRAREFSALNDLVSWMKKNYPNGIPLTDGEHKNIIDYPPI